jgi:hypothetical protein
LAWEAPCGEDYAGQPDDCDSGNCVSVASIDGGFAFRDTKPESDGSVQYYSHDELIKLGQWLVRQYDLTPES